MACATYFDDMEREKSAMIWLRFVEIWAILAPHAAAYFQARGARQWLVQVGRVWEEERFGALATWQNDAVGFLPI